MKIDKIIYENSFYPRHRDQPLDNDIKPDSEVVTDYQEYIQKHKEIPKKGGNIVINKKTMHLLDGFHRLLAAKNEGWTEIPDKDITFMDVPVEKELWVAAQLNSVHGKQLTRVEKKAILKLYWDKENRLKYGTLKEFSKDFAIPKSTLDSWILDFKPKNAESLEQGDSTKSDQLVESNEERDKLKEELEQTREELNKVKSDARSAFWEMICEQHQEAIKGCKNCGK